MFLFFIILYYVLCIAYLWHVSLTSVSGEYGLRFPLHLVSNRCIHFEMSQYTGMDFRSPIP